MPHSDSNANGTESGKLSRIVSGCTVLSNCEARIMYMKMIESMKAQINSVMPSTMAASTTWPSPERCTSHSAASTPTSSSIEPPPMSATRLSGTTGRSPDRPIACSAPVSDEVVDVVAGPRCQRPVLAPAGHPAVDQPGVAGVAVVRTDPEALGDTGPEPLEQNVGALDQAEHVGSPSRVLEVDDDAAAPAQHGIRMSRIGR